MKELSIEEKAKAYDRALEIAKAWCKLDNNDLETLFPEHKESEYKKTERILHSISSKMSLHLCDIFTEEEFQCFDTWSNAWLEKQGKQKFVEWSKEDLERINRISDFIWKNRKGDTDEIYQQEEDVKWLKSLKPFSKQKWSEEDESLRLRTIGALETCKIGYPTKCVDEQINWLKSLKPQPKQECSEYDEDMRYKATAVINKLCAEGKEYVWSVNTLKQLFYWLKSLKDRYTWKPNLAQLNALSIVSKGNAPDDIESIVSLYNDLKKLKGK